MKLKIHCRRVIILIPCLSGTEYPREVPYVLMRSVSGIAGSLLVPCIYQVTRPAHTLEHVCMHTCVGVWLWVWVWYVGQ